MPLSRAGSLDPEEAASVRCGVGFWGFWGRQRPSLAAYVAVTGPTGGAAAPPEGGNVGYPLSREARRVSGGAAGSLRRAAVRQVGAAGPGAAVHRKHFAGDEVRLGRREEQGC